MLEELMAVLPILPVLVAAVLQGAPWIEQALEEADAVVLAAMDQEDGVWYTECRM